MKALLCCVLLLSACASFRDGQAVGMHKTLNVMTEAVDPAYAFAVQACDAREQVVVRTPDTTAAQDAAALTTIREECDAVFDSFEAIRMAQLTARAAINAATQDTGRLGNAMDAVASLLATWARLREIIPALPPTPVQQMLGTENQ